MAPSRRLSTQDAERAGLKQIIGAGWRSGTHADFASQRAGDQILQRGFAPSCHHLGLPEKIIWQIERRFHIGYYMALWVKGNLFGSGIWEIRRSSLGPS